MSTFKEVFAFYFPNYHQYPFNDALYGEGWTEWDLVRASWPRFEGHQQPKVPAWGYFDSSDPIWAQKEINLAADHGITGFIIDWYWYSGVQLMQEQLEQGFLKAPNRERLKFSLMWANHPWMNFFPVAEGKSASEMNCWLPMRHTLADMEKVADYCVNHYFSEPNYWLVDGKPYFSFFSFGALEKELGGISGVARALEKFESRVIAAGFPGVHFGVNIANVDVNTLCWDINLIPQVKSCGFQSIFGYNITRTQHYANIDPALPVVDYKYVMESHEILWKACRGKSLPYVPTVTLGSDCTPRWPKSTGFPVPKMEYPYEPIVVNNTPERFEELCRKAVEAGPDSELPVLFLNGWNEWTEGNFLLPDNFYGTAYLEALKKALKK